ncbi:SymE family type I addiction module toxin [Massilia sp. W12]|uniref:SymE family type I addiction module toxin n=1 Tax=Massilia sp. W12 TaxID=3126507 RepID=UPI0030CD37A2
MMSPFLSFIKKLSTLSSLRGAKIKLCSLACHDFTQDPPAAANDHGYKAKAAGNVSERFLKVETIPDTGDSRSGIRLRGKWLKQAGFLAQTQVRVRVMPGCLVITVQD